MKPCIEVREGIGYRDGPAFEKVFIINSFLYVDYSFLNFWHPFLYSICWTVILFDEY